MFRKHGTLCLVSLIGLLGLVTTCYIIIRPVAQARKDLQLLATTQVGVTSGDEFRRMAVGSGFRLNQSLNTYGVTYQNRLLRYLHLAPPTILLMNVRIVGGVVAGITVRGDVGTYREFAKISIDERDAHQTNCGDVPVCIQQTSSTMETIVFVRPTTPLARREQLLSLNTWCLAKLGGCRSNRELFPGAWQGEQQ